MCHSSSDVLARPRRPPPESSVESSAPESAKLFLRVAESCGVAHQSPPPSPVAVPARVVPTSPPKSSEALLESQQIRPPPGSLHGVSTRVVQQAPPVVRSPSESPHKLSRVARPLRVVRRHPPSMPKSSAVRARVRPRVPIVQSAAKVFSPASRPPLLPDSPSKLMDVPSSSNHSRPPCPPTSSAVPARVARQVPVESVPESSGYRRLFFSDKDDEACWLGGCGSVASLPWLLVGVPPQTSSTNLCQSRPPELSAVLGRVVRRPRQSCLPSCFWSPHHQSRSPISRRQGCLPRGSFSL